MSTSEQLDMWAKKNKVRGWLGVFSADTLPRHVPQTPWSLVVNYENHNEPGDHWVAAMGSHGRAYYFSSFALPPDGADGTLGDRTRFRSWLSRIAPRGWRYNRVPLQSMQGDTCGLWSVYACKVRGGPCEVPAAYAWASTDRAESDRRIAKLVRL